MAGKLGLAAKIFLGTTVLAGGGAGTWYATTNGLPSMADLAPAGAAAEPMPKRRPSAEAAPLAAPIWMPSPAPGASPTQSRQQSTPDSSPVARSAEIASAETETREQIATPNFADRQSLRGRPKLAKRS